MGQTQMLIPCCAHAPVRWRAECPSSEHLPHTRPATAHVHVDIRLDMGHAFQMKPSRCIHYNKRGLLLFYSIVLHSAVTCCMAAITVTSQEHNLQALSQNTSKRASFPVLEHRCSRASAASWEDSCSPNGITMRGSVATVRSSISSDATHPLHQQQRCQIQP